MRELLPTIEAWTAEGQGVSRAVVIRTFGSSPRREGATMLRGEDGRISGSVSGGCVEGATAEFMEAAAVSGLQQVVRFGISDSEAWDVGLACGGTIDVLVQPAVPLAALEAVRASHHDRHAGRALATVLPAGSPGADIGASELGPPAPPAPPLVIHADGSLQGSLGDAGRDAALVEAASSAISSGTSAIVELAGQQVFIEAFPVRPRLVVVGAVEVAVALIALGHGPSTAVRPSPLVSAFPMWTSSSSAGRMRSPTRWSWALEMRWPCSATTPSSTTRPSLLRSSVSAATWARSGRARHSGHGGSGCWQQG